MEWELEGGSVGRGEGPRLRGLGQGVEPASVAWEGWEAAVYFGEMGALADYTLACVLDYF